MNDLAVLDYLPQPYDGRVAVIRPRGCFSGLASRTLGWDTVARKSLELYELNVYTKGMLVEPFCRSLAETVIDCLKQESVESQPPPVEDLSAALY